MAISSPPSDSKELETSTRTPSVSDLPVPDLETAAEPKIQEKFPIDPLADYDSPTNPSNPLNWSLRSKIHHTSVPGFIGLAISSGSSIYVPGIQNVVEDFHVSQTVAILGLSLYVLGLAFGPILAAPLSETHGRRAVYLISVPIFAFFTLGAGFSQNIASLAICRFFAGFFGGPVLAVGAGTVADLWAPLQRGTVTVFFIFAPFAGPAFGPVIGGFAAQYSGWRWTQWPLIFMTVLVYANALVSKETYKKIILAKMAKNLGIEPPMAGPKGLAAVKILLTITLFRPIKMLFTEMIVASLAAYIGFNFAVLYGFFDAFPYVFEKLYHFNRGEVGLVWLAILVGSVLACAVVVTIDRLRYFKEYQKSQKEGRGGHVVPEHRLYAAMLGSFGLPIGLFWFAWTARADVHYLSPVFAAIPFALGNLCVFASAAMYMVDTYGPLGGASAMAANGLVRYTLGAAFPLFTLQMYEKLGIAWATSLLGFITIGMLPIPWVLFRYGPAIRARSPLSIKF
ncbi:hypothetical protein MMC25_001318 [Agyrium rufum]|nr:hypothetical protein [Agyrium rufum]